ncbi:sugar ABC transporter substrate-binding protein [Brachybacterium huguangmaarense]|uniref:Sugar ABC transporter substrate-binding protein n=1 Tax=Brachybacterium huguangmaarense TaxID=1652028 RepID=A0ABY6G1Y8_9MICO|nr:sugar ABC transporter substrate-binding protein [Brachybacterium huguangmaarense]UYG17226.1 sugar ABC transporter substrate-binding protein [Brachybacterium huguangmaarense]
MRNSTSPTPSAGAPRRLSRRTLLGSSAAAVGAAAAATTLSACGGGSASGKVQLDYWLWDANQLPAYAQAIDLFMERNPDIDVRITQMGWDDYWTKLTAGFVAEAGPDVFTDHLGRYPEFVKLQVISPLDDFEPIAEIPDDQFKEGLQDLWTGSDGKKYGVPKDYDTIAIFYDKALLSEAGVAPEDLDALDWNPQDGGSYEKMLAHLTVDKNGKRGDEAGFDPKAIKTYGMAADPSIDYVGQSSWSGFAFSTGWTFTNERTWGTAFNYDDPKFQETVDWYFGLVDKGFLAPFGTFGDSSPKQSQLQAHSAALALDGSWMISTYRNLADVDLGITSLPSGPIGTPMSMFNGLGDSMSIQSEHKEEAARLIAFLGSNDSQEIIGGRTVVFPASDAGTDAAVAAYKKKGLDVTPFTDRVDKGETGLYPLVEHAAEISSIMQSAFDRLWMRQIQASDFTSFNDRVNALFT